MKRVVRAALAASLGIALAMTLLAGAPIAASTAASEVDQPLRVLIIGDSVTQGSAGDFTWRYRLWNEFQRQGIAVDFVGPRDDLFDNVTREHGSQDYADPAFDRDHAARWGMLAGWLDIPIAELTTQYQPDVIVAMLGVNEVLWGGTPEGAIDSLRDLLTEAQATDPEVDVVLGEATQTWAAGGKVVTFNAMLPGLAAEFTDVTIATTSNDFQRDADTWDPLHPSATGEVKIAQATTVALADLGLMSPMTTPPVAINGPRSKPTLTATRIGDTVQLDWTLPPGATAGHLWTGAKDQWTQGERTTDLITTVTAPAPGQTISYQLQPSKGTQPAAEDAYSDVVTVSTPEPPVQPPDAPRDVKLRKVDRRIQATWSSAPTATRYQVHLRTKGSWRPVGSTRQDSWTSPRLGRGRYAIKVQSWLAATPGKASAPKTILL